MQLSASATARRIFRISATLRTILLVIYVGVSFLEPARWCVMKMAVDSDFEKNCKRSVYPNSALPQLPVRVAYLLEIVLLLLILGCTLYRRVVVRLSKTALMREACQTVLTAFAILELTIQLARRGEVLFSVLIKPLLCLLIR
jgi:hypothetical protein